MLRRRSDGVAKFSQHMLGHAMDFYIPGVPLEQLRVIGLRLQRGGVGFYPTSGSPFVHMDTGNIRHWPRMTREQLVRVFPDGRTVHIPTDGRPLPGYALALADIEKRGATPSEMSIEAARSAGDQRRLRGRRPSAAAICSPGCSACTRRTRMTTTQRPRRRAGRGGLGRADGARAGTVAHAGQDRRRRRDRPRRRQARGREGKTHPRRARLPPRPA